jgi:spore coat protein H
MRIIWMWALGLLTIGASGQRLPQPPANEFYRTDVVPRIDITIPADSLAAIFANVTSDYEYHASFAYTAPGYTVSGVEVGLRLRGNTSRTSGKKSFKISFNSFISGTRLEGVKELNLNGEHNDPSIMRARIAWELAQDAGMPAPRVNHVRLFINGQPYGLYANIEHLNDDYVEHRFARDAGNLYKCLWPADLANLGTDPNSYKLMSGGRQVYELKTNETLDDYSGLARFVTALHATTSTQALCALDSVFNVNSYLKWLAWEVTTGHWDNHSFNKNNFYLYEDPASGLMEFISYDADNTFGIDWFNIDWATRSPFQFGTYPLYTKILTNPAAQRRLKLFLNEFGTLAGSAAWRNRNEALRAQLAPFVEEDVYRTFDYGYDSLDFWNALDVAGGAHVKSGIHPFMTSRIAATSSQVPTGNVEPIVFVPRLSGHGGIGVIPVQVEVWDESTPNVMLHYQPSGGSWQSFTLFDDGTHGDELAGDRLYGGLVPASVGGISYYVTATDDHNASTSAPCSPAFWATYAHPNVLINEACSDNATGPAAPNGSREDWIELRNPSSSPVGLNGLFLSDNSANPGKAALSGHSIPANGRLLFWAAGGTGFTRSLDFKLDKNGEGLALNAQSNGGWVHLDEVRLPPLMPDQSFGRRHDDAFTWVVFDQFASPSASNSGTLSSPELNLHTALLAYPNPFASELTLVNSGATELVVTVTNAYGQLLGQHKIEAGGTLRHLDAGAPGLRILHCSNGQTIKVLKHE